MALYEGKERRHARRTALTTCCPVSFTYKNITFSATMFEISEKGAGLCMSNTGDKGPGPGEEIEIQAKTPFGDSFYKVKVIRARERKPGIELGITFKSLSRDPRDPLRSMIESSF